MKRDVNLGAAWFDHHQRAHFGIALADHQVRCRLGGLGKFLKYRASESAQILLHRFGEGDQAGAESDALEGVLAAQVMSLERADQPVCDGSVDSHSVGDVGDRQAVRIRRQEFQDLESVVQRFRHAGVHLNCTFARSVFLAQL